MHDLLSFRAILLLLNDKLRVRFSPGLSKVVLPSSKSKTVPSVFKVDKVMDEPEGIQALWNPRICCKSSEPDPMAKGERRGKRVSAELEDEAGHSDLEEPELQT